MINDDLLYRLRSNEATFALKMIHSSKVTDFSKYQPGDQPQWEYVTPDKIQQKLEELENGQQFADKATIETVAFLWAARLIIWADKDHRYWIDRLSVRGIRNLKPRIVDAIEHLKDCLVATELKIYFPELARKVINKQKLTESQRAEVKNEITPLLYMFHQALKPIKEELAFPLFCPVLSAYLITEGIIKTASEGCRAYLQRFIPHGVLTQPKFDKIIEKLEQDFPEEADAILTKIREEATQDHLSAISIGSKDDQLVVNIVNVKSQLLTMEGWKFLELIKNHEEPICLGDLDRKGSWEAEPLLTFSNNRVGELSAVYTANDSTLRVICQREHSSQNGKKYTPDKAAFILDQDYLLCLYIAILHLKNNKLRFDELREKAATKVTANIKDLFDPELFEG